MKPVPKLLITDITVWPTDKPEEARTVATPPQTAKLDKISAVGLSPEVIQRLGRVTKRKQ